jgi:hypothetical protein
VRALLASAAPGSPRRGGAEEQADLVWSLLKGYSLLTVRGGTASMHRLLRQELRRQQAAGSAAAAANVGHCVWAVQVTYLVPHSKMYRMWD